MHRSALVVGLLFFASAYAQIKDGPTGKNPLAWVTGANGKTGVVELQSVVHKINIEYKSDGNVTDLTNIVEIDFRCVKDKDGSCDFVSPYEFFVSGKPVKILRWQFQRKIKNAWVAHGPGDDKGEYKEGLIVHATINKEDDTFFQLRTVVSPRNSARRISTLKRHDKIEVVFPPNKPYKAYVNGVEMDIVVFTAS